MHTNVRSNMISIKRILCPLDFSEESLKALRTAGALSQHFNAELLIINAVPPVSTISEEADYSFYNFDVPTFEDKLVRVAKKKLKSIISKRISKKIKVRSLVQLGDPAHVIVKIATKKRADLIVIATHGRTHWTRLVFGSVVEKVIRLAPCPVLIIGAKRKKK